MIYVDRQLISPGGNQADPAALDSAVSPAVVAAMEIYRSPAEIPAEFKGSNADCGVIVVWTHKGGGD